jgi:hypothetical protein
MPKVCVVSAPSIVPFFFCRAPRRPLLPTALGYRLTPHCPNAHLRPLPQQHVPTDFNASKLFSLDSPLRPASVWSSRRRRLEPRPRFDAPPRRDRLLHALRGAGQAQSHGAGDGLWSASVLGSSEASRLDRVKAQPRSAYSPISRRAWPCGHGHCAAERRHVDHKGAQAFSSLIVVVAVEFVDNLVSTRSCSSRSSPVELPTSTSTNPL